MSKRNRRSAVLKQMKQNKTLRYCKNQIKQPMTELFVCLNSPHPDGYGFCKSCAILVGIMEEPKPPFTDEELYKELKAIEKDYSDDSEAMLSELSNLFLKVIQRQNLEKSCGLLKLQVEV